MRNNSKIFKIFLITLASITLIIVGYLVIKRVTPIETETYSQGMFSFSYPKGATITELQSDKGTRTIRVRISDSIYFDLSKNADNQINSVIELANKAYQIKTESPLNQEPKMVDNAKIKAFQLTRYLQNVEFDILREEAFIETPEGIYILNYGLVGEDKNSYQEAHDIFEIILSSMSIISN